jgi:magnesium transporter
MHEEELSIILQELQDCLAHKHQEQLCVDSLANLHPTEIAQILNSLDNKDKISIWDEITDSTKGGILKELGETTQELLLNSMNNEAIVECASSMDTDDIANIVHFLPESALHNLLLTLDNKHRENLKQILSYPINTAGSLMNTDIITIRDSVSVRTVIRYLRLLGSMPKDTDQLFVVDRDFKYLGSVHISALLSNPADSKISTILSASTIAINGNTSDQEVATLFQNRDLISAPVVDEHNQLIGRITIDDAVDVITDLAEKSVKSIAGLGDDELFSPVLKSSKNRGIWLGINLLTAVFAVFFIDIFSQTIQETIALAVLMPIVASMGGIAGTQSLILITRGVATGVANTSNILNVLNKEIIISFINATLWATVIAAITYLWFDNSKLSAIIGFAIIINIISAAIFGSLLPIVLHKFKIDPALAGGVILTTITDIIGFVVFLGIASIFL